MAGRLRLGAVDYLNARPLVAGLDNDPQVDLRFDLPSICARLLADGDIDLGLVPTITYLQRPGDRVVPGIGIVSDGPVDSVAIFTRRPIRAITSLALDTSSRTSVALTRILCARVFGVTPSFIPHGPDLRSMLAAGDAALLIGDPALFADYRSLACEKIDLGQAWTAWTGCPFVWAFWSGPATAADAGVVRRLQRARDEGVANSDAIAGAYCQNDPARQSIAQRYLRERVNYDLSNRALDGLKTFYREAAALRLVERDGPIEFY